MCLIATTSAGDILENKHKVEANLIRVFLSSSMKNERFKDQRRAIKSFFERMPLYELFIIEDSANPEEVQNRYTRKAKNWTDLVILVLQKDLRDGVVKEYGAAKRGNKRIFSYIHTGKKEDELEEFIVRVKEEAEATVTEFSDLGDLIDKIEKDLLEDLVEKYKSLYQQNLKLKRQLEDLSPRSQKKFNIKK